MVAKMGITQKIDFDMEFKNDKKVTLFFESS